MSVASHVRHTVERLDRGTFLRSRDLPGPRAAVNSALSQLVAEGELVRAHTGLYYRPPTHGRRRPLPAEVGLVLGGRGAGPAGVSAARVFGVTTQVPGVQTIAVPGRAPANRDDIRFVTRPRSRRAHDLTPYEVGLLEVLHDFENVAEAPFDQLSDTVQRAAGQDRIRADRVRAAVEDERDLGALRRWRRIDAHLDPQRATQPRS